MSRYSVIRLLDTFFRRWWLYLIPFVLLCGLGVVTVVNKADSYKSVGSVYVASSTLLQKINGTDSGFGWETPAASTSKQINSQLQTDQFINSVATRAGIDTLIASRVLSVEKVRGWILAFDTGPNLLNVVVTSENPQISQRVAQATIDGFIQSVVDVNLGDSEAAVAYLDGVLTTAQTDVVAAQEALDAYLAEFPAPSFGLNRPDEQTAAIARLNAAVDQAQARFDSAYSKREDAKLSTEQTKVDLGRQLRVVDAPQVPVVPLSGKKSMVMGFGVFAAMGALLTLASVVVAATLDHGIRYAADLRERTGLRVLATVPRAKVMRTSAPRRSGRGVTAPALERERLLPGTTVTRTTPARRRPGTPPPAPARANGTNGTTSNGAHGAGRPVERRPDADAAAARARTAPPAPRPAVTRPAASRPPVAPPAPPARPPVPAPPRRDRVAEVEAPAPMVQGEVEAGSWSRRRRPSEAEGTDAGTSGWPPGRLRGGDVPHAS